jgi:hypothetical protein
MDQIKKIKNLEKNTINQILFIKKHYYNKNIK